jgi:hypothetical protein
MGAGCDAVRRSRAPAVRLGSARQLGAVAARRRRRTEIRAFYRVGEGHMACKREKLVHQQLKYLTISDGQRKKTIEHNLIQKYHIIFAGLSIVAKDNIIFAGGRKKFHVIFSISLTSPKLIMAVEKHSEVSQETCLCAYLLPWTSWIGSVSVPSASHGGLVTWWHGSLAAPARIKALACSTPLTTLILTCLHL